VSRRRGVALWAVLLLVGGGYSLALGQDMSGDQRNNHVYAVWRLFHPQQDIAWGVGGVAGYLPANWDIPWYFAAMHLPTPVTVFLLGMLHAVSVGLAASIAWSILRQAPLRARCAATVISTGFAVWAPAFQSEFGTTYGNIVTAIPVLGAVLLIVRRNSALPSLSRSFAFGLLLGLAFGLRLTNACYLIAGLCAFLAVGFRSVEGLRGVFVAGFGAVTGSLVTGGAQFIATARRFDNPLFPFYNAVFRSPFGPDANLRDERFAVHTVSDALLMPFAMMTRSGYPSELSGRDWRWALLLGVSLIVLITRLAGGIRSPGWVRGSDRAFVLVFVAVGFLLWDVQFAIARYILPIELMSGVALLCLVDLLAVGVRTRLAIVVLAILVAAPVIVVPRFFHQSPWRDSWFAFEPPDLARQSHLLVVFPTMDNASFLVAALPADARAVQVPRIYPEQTYTSGVVGREDALVREVLDKQRGPVVSITAMDGVAAAAHQAADYGFRIPPNSCQTLRTSYQDYLVCPWDRSPL
jgi:hypothetical protein